MKKWIKYQLNNKDKTMPILSYPTISKLNITVPDLINSSDNLARGIKLIADTCPVSAVLTCMDLSVEAEALGSTTRQSDNEVPTVIGSIINSHQDIDNLNVPDVSCCRTKLYIEAVKKAKAIVDDKPIFGGVIGPFSLGGRLMDMTEIMVNCYMEPDLVTKTLNKCSEFLINYILSLKEAGADGVIMAEPAAGILSPALCEEFSSSYIRNIIDKVSSEDFVFVYHNCGNVIPLLDSIKEVNADVYHFGNAIDIEQALKLMPKEKPVMGNINPLFFKDSSPQEIREITLSLLERCGRYDNFVISSGCDIPPMAEWDNINAYFDTVASFYSSR